MEVPKDIRNIISEYTVEGYLYLYTEQPSNMKLLHGYLNNCIFDSNESIYRRTDLESILKANISDVIELERVSSWSYNTNTPNAMYEGIPSRILILRDTRVHGLDVTPISFYKEEAEVLLAPCKLRITSIFQDIVEVSYLT